jgi:hypothetical protein
MNLLAEISKEPEFLNCDIIKKKRKKYKIIFLKFQNFILIVSDRLIISSRIVSYF